MRRQPHPHHRPPILTDVAVDALPARNAITVIATNQVFARKSIKARLPFTFIGVCGGEGGRWGSAPPACTPDSPAAPAAAAAHPQHTGHARASPAGPLPSWQVAPTHCSGQTHSKPSTWSTQVPPAAQGLEAHSSMSVQGQGGVWGWAAGKAAVGLALRPGLSGVNHAAPSRLPEASPEPPSCAQALTERTGGPAPA